MHSNQGLILSALLLTAFVAMQLAHVDGRRGNGIFGFGSGSNSHERLNLTTAQCRLNGKFLSLWLPQSPVLAAFQTVCGRVGVAQTWNLLQGLLGVPATGALNQATFQALLNNTNQALLAQQLLALGGATAKLTGK